MKYWFSDINNKVMYETARVVLIAGQYPVFNNIVIDRIRDSCKGSIQEIDQSAVDDLMSEFVSTSHGGPTGNSLDFSTFLEVVKVPPVDGKWFCHVDYAFLTKKQKEAFDRYIKKPNDNGVLVVSMLEWKDYKDYIKNRAVTQNKSSHIIQLNYPNRAGLKDIVIKMFKDRGIYVAEQAVELFIMRMSNAYTQYEETIDKICLSAGNKGSVDYGEMTESLKGIENYVLDDFIYELMNPIKSKKVVTRRRIYKMLNAVITDMGAKAIVNKIKFKLDDLIEMRIQINNGNIPVMVRYNIEKVKGRLGEENRLNKLSDYAFKRYAYLASQTSLKDWYYMKLILNNIKNTWSEEENERALLALVHRSTMSDDRLLNDIGVKNTLEEGLVALNSVFYNPYVKKIDNTVEVDGNIIDITTGEIIE